MAVISFIPMGESYFETLRQESDIRNLADKVKTNLDGLPQQNGVRREYGSARVNKQTVHVANTSVLPIFDVHSGATVKMTLKPQEAPAGIAVTLGEAPEGTNV